MKELHISKKELDTIDINKRFAGYIVSSSEFFAPPGTEHYRLLAYLSSKVFDDASIIDIGTHIGSSALALSYNPNNMIHTFDIVEKMSVQLGSPLMELNIKFYKEDLFCAETRKKYMDLILNSDMIMMDIDPHEGSRELEFYKFLEDKKYEGIVIFDDINHFSSMRLNFWKHVKPEHKYNLTSVGHWSGTGMVSYEPLDCKIEL